MNTLHKRFVALEVVVRQLNLCLIRGIETSSESEIDKILSEPEFWSSFVQSVLQQKVTMATNADQQTTLLIPDTTSKTVKPKRSPKRKADKKTEKETPAEIAQIAEHFLKTANSREEGRAILAEYLNKHRNVKARLVSLAKYLEIPIGKLNKDKLAEKIIQETIGHRIDSMIIQEHKWDK